MSRRQETCGRGLVLWQSRRPEPRHLVWKMSWGRFEKPLNSPKPKAWLSLYFFSFLLLRNSALVFCWADTGHCFISRTGQTGLNTSWVSNAGALWKSKSRHWQCQWSCHIEMHYNLCSNALLQRKIWHFPSLFPYLKKKNIFTSVQCVQCVMIHVIRKQQVRQGI